MTSRDSGPVKTVARVFAEVVVDRNFQGNRLTAVAEADGSVTFVDESVKKALALDMGLALMRCGKVPIEVRDHSPGNLYLSAWVYVTDPAAEPAPAPAPSMPPISELREEAKREKRDKRRHEIGTIANLMRIRANELADGGDYEGSHILFTAAVSMLLAANYEEGEI